jgi:curved DNA-binding protein CbpA
MARDYYRVLGISPNATPEEIRSAYRRKAKHLHPDRAGGGCRAFQAIQEAYEVLGDPVRRQAHDEQLARETLARPSFSGCRSNPLRQSPRPAEPLVPRRKPPGRSVSSPGAPLSSPFEDLVRTSLDDWPSTGGARRIHLDIYLTPDEAWTGGSLRTSIPVRTWCPACRGWGSRALFACARCLGRGFVDAEYPLEITFPAGIADRSTWTIPFRRPGLDDAYLVLRFRVGES